MTLNPDCISTNICWLGKPRCPHAYKPYRYMEVDFCDINSKLCILENGLECSIWNNVQQEWANDER